MAIARFEMPDGKTARVEFPDGTTPEQAELEFSSMLERGEIAAGESSEVPKVAMSQEQAPPPAAPTNPIMEYGQAITQPNEMDAEALRVAATGVKQGLGAVPQLAGQLYSGAERGFAAGMRKMGVPEIPGMQDVPSPGQFLRQGLDYLFQPRDYERPQTEMGGRAANVLGSGIAAFTGPGTLAAPARTLGAGLSAGIGAEIGGEVGGSTGAIVGGLAGSMLPSALALRTNARDRVFKEAMRGVDEPSLNIAQQRMAAAKAQGVDLTLPQAMPRETGLDEMQQMLTRRAAGAPLTSQLQNQPQQIADATQRQLGTLPGQPTGQAQMANIAQEQADAALQALRQQRTEAVRPLYAAAKHLDDSDVRLFALQLKKRAKDMPNTETASRLNELAESLYLSKPVIRDGVQVGVKKIPITNPQQINDILQEARSSLKRPTNTRPQADRKTAGIISDAIKGIKAQIGKKSPEFKQAEELYAKMSKEIVDPAKQGPLGVVAQRSGYDPSMPASRTNLYGIFDRGTAKGGRSDIKTLQEGMAKSGPEGKKAFADSGTSWIADKVQGAFKMEGGKLSPQVAANLEKALYGTPNQIRGMDDVLEGIAKSVGAPPDQLKNGFKTWARTIKLASKRPSNLRATSTAEIEGAAETLAGKLASTTVLAPYRRVLEKVDDFITKDAYGYLGRLMQTPEGVQTLKELSKAQAGSPAAYTAISKFNAILAAEQAQEE